MVKNYLLVSIRNLLRYKIYSSINILGLTIGITTSLLIFGYVFYEFGYDKFIPDSENIYRITYEKYQNNQKTAQSAMTFTALGPSLKANFPEIKAETRLSYEECLIVYNETKLNDQKVLWTDSSFLYVFQLPIVNGSAAGALSKPNTAVITQKSAIKLFGNADPIGKTVLLNEGLPFLITAVVKELPENSHMNFDFLLSFATGFSQGWASEQGDWMYNWVYTYVKFNSRLNEQLFKNKLKSFTEKNDLSKKKEGTKNVYHLQSLSDIHLYSNLNNELSVNGNYKAVFALIIIALLILIIAWINFINLSTARSIERAKETGIRKVVGAEKKQLIYQFLLESVLLNVIAAVFAFLIADALTPKFSEIIGKPVSNNIWGNQKLWIAFICFFITGSLVTGLYPALVLSRFNPLDVMKSKSGQTLKGNNFRKILVIFQFTSTIILLSLTFVVYKQIRFLQTINTGIDVNQVLAIKAPRTLNLDSTKSQKFLGFKAQLQEYKDIKFVASLSNLPGEEIDVHLDDIRRIEEISDEKTSFSLMAIDYDFVNVFGLHLLAGRNYNQNKLADTAKVILNEAAVKALHYESADDAINKKIVVFKKPHTIIGVIKDYHHEGMKKNISPTIYLYSYDYIFGYNVIKLSPSYIEPSIKFVKAKWEANFPKDPFDYFFVDDVFAMHYIQEKRIIAIFSGFSFLAVVVACLGLLGLMSYFAEKRTKEIGIRKVMGANIISLYFELSKNFANLLIISAILGIPLSYYLANLWLSNYPNKIGLDMVIFITPILILIALALLTIIWSVNKTAKSNPIEALRYE